VPSSAERAFVLLANVGIANGGPPTWDIPRSYFAREPDRAVTAWKVAEIGFPAQDSGQSQARILATGPSWRTIGSLRLPTRKSCFYAHPGLTPWATFCRPSGAVSCGDLLNRLAENQIRASVL